MFWCNLLRWLVTLLLFINIYSKKTSMCFAIFDCLGGRNKSQMIIWYFAQLIIMFDIIQSSGRTFPNSYCILYFHQLISLSFSFSILHLNFLSLKLTATGDKPFHLLAMEQNLEHDNSMQKNFSERVANVHREKSNKCSLCDYASSNAGHLRTHVIMHPLGQVIWGHIWKCTQGKRQTNAHELGAGADCLKWVISVIMMVMMIKIKIVMIMMTTIMMILDSMKP